jgi:polyisoprenyl-teichoic acid--peptidoglycan teichoic acid transferase
VTPPREGEGAGKGRGPDPDETGRLGETEEFQLEDDSRSDLDESGDTAEHPAPEPPSEELEPVSEGTEVPPTEGPGDTQEHELEEIIHAETQEWDGSEVSGDDDVSEDDEEYYEDEEPESQEQTVVSRAGSAVTGGFKAVGSATTSGFQAVGRYVRFPIWARFLTASLAIVLSVGAATAASLLLYLEDIGNQLAHGNALGDTLTDRLAAVEGGEPQTIMILGSDRRPEAKVDPSLKGVRGLSDTTMLLRIDPDRNLLSTFSLPRDLKVSIPGYGVAKLNEAYFAGGPELTLRTVQELTKSEELPNGIPINHLVNVDFEGFARAVNEIDCVYVDVDRRYFNKNVDGDGEEDYEEIDIQPGYQALCGFDALDYARYRHTDNDVVRAARQQDFLREARQKVPPEVVFARRTELIDIFVEHTTSDINDAGEMLQLLKLFIEARNAPLKEVHFEGTLGPSFVTATPDEINRAVTQFMGFEDTPGARGETAAPDRPGATGDTAPDQVDAPTPAGGTKKKEKGESAESDFLDDNSDVVETSFGKELAKGIRARKIKLPVYYPTVLESGSDYAQKPRVYKINGTGDGSPPNSERAAYKWVFSRPALGEYYGFMATRWTDPPLLKNPSEERRMGDRTYKLFYDGDRLRLVAWQTDEGSFWVQNTLIQSLSDREMIEIAEGMTELPRRGG